MRFRSSSLIGVGVAIVLTAAAWAQAPRYLALSWQQAPPRPSDQMRALLASPRSDSSDRTFDSIDRVDRELTAVRAELASIRGNLVFNSTPELKTRLDQYARAEKELVSIHKGLETYENQIYKLIDWTSHMEDHAARGETPEPAHLRQFHALANQCDATVGSMEKSVETLSTLAEDLNDPYLRRFADRTGPEVTALGKVVEVAGITGKPQQEKMVSSATVEHTSEK